MEYTFLYICWFFRIIIYFLISFDLFADEDKELLQIIKYLEMKRECREMKENVSHQLVKILFCL